MTKSDLRNKYIEKRKTLSTDEVSSFSYEIFLQFIATFKPVENQKIHCFLSIAEKNEVDTLMFLDYFFENEIRVFVPKIVNGKLISVEIRKDSILTKNSWGILEPEENTDSVEKNFDFVITPLLYCDASGNRVGFGKGYYDEFFAGITKSCLKVGVSFFEPSEIVDDIWEKDIPLDYLVSPTAVLSFGN